MDDFKRQGGHLSGREERRDDFQGEPRTVGSTLGGHGADGTTSLTHPEGRHTGSSGTHNPLSSNSNTHSSVRDGGMNSSRDAGLAGSTTNGHHNTSSGTHGTTGGQNISGTGTDQKKPGLMAKLNPMVDSNGDGKAGFMK